MKKILIAIIFIFCFLTSCERGDYKEITSSDVPEMESYTVTFNTNGGNEAISEQSVILSYLAKEPQEPTKNGFIFNGWYCNGDKWRFDTPIERDICLEAQWIENHFTFIEGDSTCSIESCENVSGAVTVPDYYNGKRVTGIYQNAFKGCDKITEVILPDSIVSIGANAFEKCTLLERINIPISVRKIGNRAFMDCYCLLEIYYASESLEDFSEYNMVFYDAGIKKAGITVTFAKSVDRIPNRLFNSICPSYFYETEEYKNDIRIARVKRVLFEENSVVREVGSYAFYDLDRLTSIELPDSVKAIGDNAFTRCKKIKNLSLPNDLEKIGEWAFFECECLEEIHFNDLTISGPEIKIGKYAFSKCNSLKGLDLKNNVVVFDEHIFEGCPSLETVDLGDNVKIISPYMFKNCYALKSIVIGKQTEKIGEEAFYSCKDLEKISFPATLTTIGRYAFFRCEGIEKIIIPNNVNYIGSSSFSGCKGLKELYIGTGVKELNGYVFEYCYSLEYTYIPSTVKIIADTAFSKCTNMIAYCEADNIPNGWANGWADDIKEVRLEQ